MVQFYPLQLPHGVMQCRRTVYLYIGIYIIIIVCRYGMELNVEKTKVMRISRQPLPVKNYRRPKTTGECGIF